MLEKMRNPGEGYEAKSPESGLHTFGAERRRNIVVRAVVRLVGHLMLILVRYERGN